MVLEPWRVKINLNESERAIDLDENKTNLLFELFSSFEERLSDCHRKLCNSDKAEHCRRQCVIHAKQVKGGDDKIKRVSKLLNSLSSLYVLRGKLTEAKVIGEESYMYVSEKYNPEHPLVLEAAGNLIDILCSSKDYYDAERFARICYDSLTRPHLHPDSYEAAKAAGTLARVIFEMINKDDPDSAKLQESEMLARMAIRIKMQVLICFMILVS